MGQASLLPTTPGDSIDFAGSVVVAQPPPTAPQLFAQRGTNGLTLYWSTNFASYTLEYTLSLEPPATWTPIPGPYTADGINFEYQEAFNLSIPARFFQLAPSAP